MTYSIPNWTNNSGGIEVLLAEGARQYSGFILGLLGFIYATILGAGFFAQDRKTGAGNFSMWATISGIITTFLSFILLLYDNIISIEVVIIFLTLTIISATAYLTTER